MDTAYQAERGDCHLEKGQRVETKTRWRLVAIAIASVSVACACTAAHGQAWRDPDGEPSPESESRKSAGRFSAMLLVTSDMDWRAKWDTPPDVIPHFIEASEVRRGAQLAILVFLSNARLKNGAIDTVVDLHVKRPDGSISTNAADSPCLSGPYGGNPTNVLMCESSLMYSADATDPAGKWTVDVVLKDRHGGVEIPLHTSFQVLD